MRQRFADYFEQVRRLVARLWVSIPVIVGDAAGQASAVRLGDLSDLA